MAVRLVVKNATDLPKLDRFSKVDPFCELTFHEEKQSTSVIANNQNPEWNESFKWTLEIVPETTEVIDVVIIDHETIGKHRPFCKGAIPLAGVLEQGSVSLDIALDDIEGEPIETKLHVDLSYRAPISESLRGEVGTLKERVEELEEQLKNLKTTLAEKEAEIESLKEQVDPLKAALAEKEAELSGAKTEIDQLKASVATKETELSEAKETNEQLRAENERLKAAAAEKDAELSRIKAENEQLKKGSTSTTAEPKTEPVKPPEEPPPTTGATPAGDGDGNLQAQNEALTREVASLKQRIQELEEEQRRQPGGGGTQRQNRCCGLL